MTVDPAPAPPDPSAAGPNSPPTPEASSEETGRVEGVERTALAITVLLALGSLWWRSPRVTAGVFLGGLLATVNLFWTRSLVTNLFITRGGKPSKKLLALYMLKYLLTGMIIFAVIKYSLVHPVGLVAGLMSVFLAISFDAVVHLKKLDKEG